MFSVVFEVHPKSEQWDAYLGNAKMLRPELEQVDGFVDNIRYKSLTREGWILSLSGWRDEKSVVRWRTTMRHHEVQEKGRGEILSDYHLRVGQVTADTRIPPGYVLHEQRLDETEVGEGTTLTLLDAKAPASSKDFLDAKQAASEPKLSSQESARYLGLPMQAEGMLAWDVFDAVLTPGDLLLLISWKSARFARELEKTVQMPSDGRWRRVRVVRDYGMFDRREAPQFYPDALRATANASRGPR
jgi:heme-degrading monooxygenase HmoA